ncbi:MAG: A24 family peptidase [Nanoarchaeota archaeon]
MIETIFLFSLALVWMTFAVVQDLRKREIADWLNFSLIVFALGFRFFYSLFSMQGFGFFYQGLIGLGIFFLLGNAFYYGKMFAGGDAKLMIALGAILPLQESFTRNLEFFVIFFIIFLLVGAVYSLLGSLFFSIRNFEQFKKEFRKQFKTHFKASFLVLFFALLLSVVGFFLDEILVYLAVVVFFIPYVYMYAKAVDESCMIKKTRTSELTEGDWLYKDVRVKGKVIKATWDGLAKEQIKQLKKSQKFVLIRHGIPFSPAFLISFLIFTWLWKNGNWQLLF